MKRRRPRASETKTPLPLYRDMPAAFPEHTVPAANTTLPPEEAVEQLRDFSQEHKT